MPRRPLSVPGKRRIEAGTVMPEPLNQALEWWFSIWHNLCLMIIAMRRYGKWSTKPQNRGSHHEQE